MIQQCIRLGISTYQSLLPMKRKASLRAVSGLAQGFSSSASPFSMMEELDCELPDILLFRLFLPLDFHSGLHKKIMQGEE